MDTTSSSARLPQRDRQLDLIEREKENAMSAMKSAARDIWQQVPTTEEVAAWTKENPLTAVGIAAGAGILAGFMVAPSRNRGQNQGGGGGGGSIVGSIFGAIMPAFGLAASEVGRTALSAAVAHFTSQQVAEQNTGDDAERYASAAGYHRPSNAEAA